MRKFTLLIFIFPALYFSQYQFKKAFEAKNRIFYLKEIGDYKAWLKDVNSIIKIKQKNGTYKTTGGDFNISLVHCNCGDKTIAIKRVVVYDRYENLISDNSYDDATMLDAIPDTVGENVLNIVCGWEDYPIDKELKELFKEYSQLEEISEETFYNNFNQIGENYLKIVKDRIKELMVK